MKTFIQRIAAAAIIGLSVACSASAAESLSVLLQRGIYAEETEGNLDSAIKIYEQIAAEGAANRSLIAQAQYRLAVCYQKQGKKEQAVKLLTELMQHSGTDVGLTAKAKEALTGLGAPLSANISIRKIPLPVTVIWFGAISPDGRIIAYRTTGTFDLLACDLVTGKSWTLAKRTNDQEVWGDVVFSPDGQWVAYDHRGSAIYVTKVDGSTTRKLYDSGAKEDEIFTSVLYWSPDGKDVVTEFSKNSKSNPVHQLFAITLDTGTRKSIEVKGFEVSRPTGGDSYSFSSSGRFCAYRDRSYPRRITIWDAKTGRSEVVVDHGAGRVIGWSPDDTRLLFEKTRDASIDLYVVGVKDGKPFGESAVVWSNWGDVRAMGPTRDGNIFYAPGRGNRNTPRELWVMEGFLSRITIADAWKTQRELSPDEITGPDNSINDRKLGLSASIPSGWSIGSAVRRENGYGGFITFKVPGTATARPAISYRSTDPWEFPEGAAAAWMNALGAKPATPSEVDSWLQKYAQMSAEARATRLGYTNYQTRPASVSIRSIDGHRALTWTGDFKRSEKEWVEFVTVILGDAALAQFWLQASAADIDAVQPAFSQMIDSARLR